MAVPLLAPAAAAPAAAQSRRGRNLKHSSYGAVVWCRLKGPFNLLQLRGL
jgi:hypothetical protein